jgi:hypothetical protein
MPRKHIGIIQSGKNAGRLRKGYRFNGKRTKTGLAIIVKTQKRSTQKRTTQRKQRGGIDRGPVEDPVDERVNENNVPAPPPPPPPTPILRRQTAVYGRQALDTARREQRERQRLRAQAAVERMRNHGRTTNSASDTTPPTS